MDLNLCHAFAVKAPTLWQVPSPRRDLVRKPLAYPLASRALLAGGKWLIFRQRATHFCTNSAESNRQSQGNCQQLVPCFWQQKMGSNADKRDVRDLRIIKLSGQLRPTRDADQAYPSSCAKEGAACAPADAPADKNMLLPPTKRVGRFR